MKKVIKKLRKWRYKFLSQLSRKAFAVVAGQADRTPKDKISTTFLVDKIQRFCEIYSGKTMYPYQKQFSKRIIRSVLENDGAELTALFARQSGKTETVATTVGGMMIILPQLANLPMFLNDGRLQPFRDGLWVGIFAPSQRQAQTTYNRMKSRLQCQNAIDVLNDPDFLLDFTTSNGQTVALSNGSFCTAISASDSSNIEGESFKFIICEECFVEGTPVLTETGYKNIEEIEAGEKVYSFNHRTNELELKKVERSFSQPLYGRKIVTITTESGKKIVCTDNHKIFSVTAGEYVRAENLRPEDLMLSYAYTTQESGCNDERADAFGLSFRGCKSTISSQGIFKKSAISSASYQQSKRLCLEEVRPDQELVQSGAKNCSEFGEGVESLSVCDSLSSRASRMVSEVLLRRKESCFEGNFRSDERRSSCLLVHGRRKFFGDDEYSYSSLHDEREQNSCRLAHREIRCNSNYQNGQENRQAVSILQGKREEQISEVDSSLYCSFDGIQDSFDGRKNSLCNLWETNSSISPQGSSVFRRVPERISERVPQKVLSTEKIEKIEIEEREEVMVYDLTVADNHNFFADSILVHNCQDISNFKIRKSIHPMGAAYNATICKIGTCTTYRGDFYDAIQRNKSAARPGYLRNHFEYDYKVVEKFNPKYKNYIEREKKSLGENSDEFRLSYCVVPETKILTADLRYVRADSLKVGDELLGFDEDKPKVYGQRKFCKTIVQDVGKIRRDCYHLTFEDGTEITCSKEHKWLVFTAGSRTQWKKTEDLVYTDRVYRACDVWEMPNPNDYRLGYLAAAFDGEGCISQVGGKLSQISFTQRDNIMLEKVRQYLTDFGFSFSESVREDDEVNRLLLTGGRYETLRFLGTVRPERLLDNFTCYAVGTLRTCKKTLPRDFSHPRLVKKEFVGEKVVIPIRTSSRTYVAEGLCSHNCLEWILSRGMFVELSELESNCGDDYRERVPTDHIACHVIGIDIGGGSSRNKKEADSTVITVVEVDWDRPVLMENTHDEETGEDITYLAYNTYLVDWYEISPEVAENYEEQYQLILDYLKKWSVAKVVVDATREASLAHRLRANLNCEVEPFVFGLKSKSEMYKFLDTEIKTGRARFPMGAETIQTKEYKKFTQQLSDLEKSYSGSNLVVHHPPERGAHDDYPDSWALAVWGTRDPGHVDNTETHSLNRMIGGTNVKKYNPFERRNRLTGRRR